VSNESERLPPLTDAERSYRRRRQRTGAVHIGLDLAPDVLDQMIDRGIISERDALDRRKVSVALEAELPELFVGVDAQKDVRYWCCCRRSACNRPSR
jgi:hypothetical protein